MAEASAKDISPSAGSEFVPDNSLSVGSEFVFDNVCQPCMSDGKFAEAEKYCQDCCEHLCSQCTGFHHKLSYLKGHNLLCSEDVIKNIKATFVGHIKIKVRTGFLSFFSPRFIEGITGLALVSVERLVAVDVSNNRLLLIDTTKKKTISEFKTDSKPWDVTVCGGEVAATLPWDSKIIFLKCDDGLVYARDLCVNGECGGIACFDDKLCVVFNIKKKIEVMTVTGYVLQRFDTDGQGGQLFKNPMYVAVSTVNQSIYVTDCESKELIVLGLDGKMKGRYKDSGVSDGFGQLARDTSTGAIYLCDPDNDTIHLLSHLCEKVKILLTEQDGLEVPWSVCYCGGTRRLYIGMVGGIKVYHISCM